MTPEAWAGALTNAEMAEAHAEHARQWWEYATYARTLAERVRGFVAARQYARSARLFAALARDGRWNGGMF